jgi:hypothetical protein
MTGGVTVSLRLGVRPTTRPNPSRIACARDYVSSDSLIRNCINLHFTRVSLRTIPKPSQEWADSFSTKLAKPKRKSCEEYRVIVRYPKCWQDRGQTCASSSRTLLLAKAHSPTRAALRAQLRARIRAEAEESWDALKWAAKILRVAGPARLLSRHCKHRPPDHSSPGQP